MTATQAAEKLGIKKQMLKKHLKSNELKATWRKNIHGQDYRWITPAAIKDFEAIRRKRGERKK